MGIALDDENKRKLVFICREPASDDEEAERKNAAEQPEKFSGARKKPKKP